MTVDRLIRIFAGSFILVSLAAFVGANLLQFGFTDVCPLGWILRKLGVPDAPARSLR